MSSDEKDPSTVTGWLRDLTRECVESNPGPLWSDLRRDILCNIEPDVLANWQTYLANFGEGLRNKYRGQLDFTLEDVHTLLEDDKWIKETYGVDAKVVKTKIQDGLASIQPPPPGLQLGPSSEYKFAQPKLLTGNEWPYQHSSEVLQRVGDILPTHYAAWQGKLEDKTKHPIFIIPAAPGTGKSRMLDEFYNICLKATETNQELQNRLKTKCFVFKCTYENGTPPAFTNDLPASQQIGARIQYQLWENHDIAACAKLALDCSTVISRVLEAEGVASRDATVLLLIDGVQKLHQQGNSLVSLMDAVSALVNSSKSPFTIAAVAGTFYEPIEKVLRASAQLRVILDPPEVDGHAVITAASPLEYIMIDDMGGHGRALEALNDQFAKIPPGKSLQDMNPEFIFDGIVNRIIDLYPDLRSKATILKPVIAAILSHSQLQRTHSFGAITVEEAIELGMFRFNQKTCRLECPFFLIYLFARLSADKVLTHIPLLNYSQIKGSDNAPCTTLFWQDWEDFVGQFRVLKGYFYGGQEVPFSELHAGALNATNEKVTVPSLTRVEQLQRIYAPADALTLLKSDPQFCLHNAATADYADGYCCLLDNNNTAVLEAHQYKRKSKKSPTNSASFEDEYDKAVSSNKDFFILFATNRVVMDTSDPKFARCAVVCKDNFADYFGPFAGRAFCVKKDINTASYAELQEVTSIGPTKATKIITA